jgi:hypothetical protein
LDEARVIQALHQLAERWPKTLTLVSVGGSLSVIHTRDARLAAVDGLVRAESILDDIIGIPNDGGDW